MRNSAAPIRDERQRIIGAVVFNEDVTERVRAEEEVARRERAAARACAADAVGAQRERRSILARRVGIAPDANARRRIRSRVRVDRRRRGHGTRVAGTRPWKDGGGRSIGGEKRHRSAHRRPASTFRRDRGQHEGQDRTFQRGRDALLVWSIANVLATSIEQAHAMTRRCARSVSSSRAFRAGSSRRKRRSAAPSRGSCTTTSARSSRRCDSICSVRDATTGITSPWSTAPSHGCATWLRICARRSSMSWGSNRRSGGTSSARQHEQG